MATTSRDPCLSDSDGAPKELRRGPEGEIQGAGAGAGAGGGTGSGSSPKTAGPSSPITSSNVKSVWIRVLSMR